MTETFEDRRQIVLAESLREIQRLRAEVNAAVSARTAPIAIVGMACRMPGGAEDPEEFWRFLRDGGDAVREVPDSRLAGSAVGPGPWRGAFLSDVETFDAAFFGVSAREAASMDPQQRLLLEVGWEALEDAGIDADRLAGSPAGVFLGVTNLDYNSRQLQEVDAADLEPHFATSGAAPFGAGRLSYWLGLTGPSLTVDTACSSSLVGVHLACQSLRAGDCDAALAGGVNVMLSPESFLVLGKTGALSPDGACRTFDAAANGYVRGEGCGVVVLKRLADAESAGDRILAVIRGSAVNQDGRSSGLTVPNPIAQRAVVRRALEAAGVRPAEVDYVEAHGTGTPLGDPIELRALGEVFGTPDRERPLAVGSVKTNIGHLEPAAGVAGLIKVVLSLGHGEIPAHRGLVEINPEIGIEELAITIPTETTPWPRGPRPRLAGVSSFGASGTNAHLVVGEAPLPAPARTTDGTRTAEPAERVALTQIPDSLGGPRTPARTVHLLTLSAKSPAALCALARRYAARLAAAGPAEIADICFTANTGRARFSHRLAVVGATSPELAERLTAFADGAAAVPGTCAGHARPGTRPRATFLFTGQSAQYAGMAQTLNSAEPVFAAALDRCERILRPLLERPLSAVLWPGEADRELIHETRWTQPALLAVEYALAELWRSWGVTPAAVIGHSVGELAAACAAGAVGLEDALRIAARRGELMQTLCEPGAMAAVSASEDRILQAIAPYTGRLALAAVNGPHSTVVSGDREALAELTAALAGQGVKVKALSAGRAFHSPLVDPVLDAYEAEAASARFCAPRIPLVSNVTGGLLAGDGALSAAYLRRHVREPVRFFDGMTRLYDDGHRVFVEIGPAPTLLGMARRFAPEGSECAFLPSLRPGHDDCAVLLESLGRLFVLGYPVDWDAFEGGGRRRVALPTYAFQRERHWYRPSRRTAPSAPSDQNIDTTGTGAGTDPDHAVDPARSRRRDAAPATILGRRVSSPLSLIQYHSRLDVETLSCVGDCVLDGLTIVNIGVYLEAAFSAVREIEGGGPYVVDDCTVLQSLVMSESGAHDTQLHLEPVPAGGALFRYYADHPGADGRDDWRLHARGRIHRDATIPTAVSGRSAIKEHGRQLPHELSGVDFYRLMWRRKLYLGPEAQWIEDIRFSETEAVARMRLPRPGETDGFLLHPGLTDSMFQLMFACLPRERAGSAVYALVSIDRLVFHEYDPCVPLFGRVRLTGPAGGPTITADFGFEDELGRPVFHATGVVARRAERDSVLRVAGQARPESRSGPRPAPEAATTPTPAQDAAPSRAVGDPVELVVRHLAAALRADPASLDRHESLQNLGLDSLMALEVRDALSADLGVAPPLTAFLEGGSISGLGRLLAEQLRLSSAATADTVAGTAPDAVTGTGADSGAMAAARESGDAAALPEVRRAGLPELRHDASGRYEPFPMTDLQQAYWVGRSDAFALGRVSTYFFTEVDLVGVDPDRLEDSLQLMIARHDMLRAVARPDGDQRILAEVPRYVIRRTDLRGSQEPERERVLAAIHREMKNQVLDAAVWPAWEVRATRIDEKRTRLHIGLDALMADAWSTSLLFREWATAYAGGFGELPELPVTYRDYVLALREMEQGEIFQRSLDYWRERIAVLPPAPELPLARMPETVERPEFVHHSARIERAQWARFKQHAAKAGVTASAALCAAYSQVLAAWSRSNRFTLNVLFFNRLPLHPAVGGIVGNFTATTMLEVDSAESDPFAVRAARVQRQLWSDLEHSHVSGVRVLRELSRARGGALVTMPVVFASTVDFGVKENASTSGFAHHLTAMAESGREVWSSIRTPQVWLDHQAVEDDGAIVVNWDVIEELFPAGMVDAMFEAYVAVLRGLCRDEEEWDRPAGMLVPVPELEVRAARNATAAPLPGGLLHHGFLARAAVEADRVAVIGAERTLTYGELDSEANRVHHWLHEHGAGHGSLVAIVMDKGWEQIAAAIGILKAGAAYVPIDGALPAERMRLILASAGITAALTQAHLVERVDWPVELSVLEIGGREAALLDDSALPAAAVAPNDLAYVIFTSGSTGVPKGVMIEHAAALNTVADVNERFGVTGDDRVLALSALNFDLSVYDVFGLLAVGGAVVLPSPGMSREPAQWARLVAEHRVTVWNTVPTLMEMFTEHCLGSGAAAGRDCPVRLVMMSGDWIPVTLPERIRAFLPEAAVWSLGGATEAAIWSICYPIAEVDPEWLSIPYGYPMRNQRFHVLDEGLRPRPVWAPGHLYISGAGLARGYLGDEAKTAAAFIRHPMTGERLYRTGDLGRYLPDGAIEFLGREDSQVKVQGYRIELGDVEAALAVCPGVRAAVAAVDSTATGKRLLGYVVLDGLAEGEADADSAQQLTRVLREKLPDYMVPQRIVVLEQLPLTANGKVDRASLPVPEAVGPAQRSALPLDAVEEALVEIWGGFFPDRAVDTVDNFFDLGGDSLLAVRLMAGIERRFGRTLPVASLFARPTIAALAEALSQAAPQAPREALVPVRTDGPEPPLFFIHPVGGDVLCYAELARLLGPDVPFYALQTPDTEPALGTVAELADHYAKAVLAVVPEGPFRLGGWSMGGVIALEAARRLAELDRGPELVVAIDLLGVPRPASASDVERASEDEVGGAELLAWLAGDLAGLAGVGWRPEPTLFESADRRAAVAVLHRELGARGVLTPDVGLPTLERIVERFARNARALAGHRPRPYSGAVRLLRAADGGATEETTRAWLALLPGDAAAVEVPGNHYTAMQGPNVTVLARTVRSALSAARHS